MLNLLQSTVGPGGVVACHDYTGKVRFLSTETGKPISRSANLPSKASPEEASRTFLTDYGSLFGLSDQVKELTVMRSLTGEQGNGFVRFQQVYHGVPIIAGEIIVQIDPHQQVVSAGGELLPDLSLSVTPHLTADQARAQVFGKVAKTYKVDPAHLTSSIPELSIYDPRLLSDSSGYSQLVWKMTVESDGSVAVPELFKEFVLVDAGTGAIPLSFNQIEEAKNRLVCNNNNVPVTPAGDCTAPVRIEGQGPNAVDDVNKAYDYAGATYDFYKNNFNRDSLDNAGLTLKSTVKFCFSINNCPYQNAFWNGTQMYYGEGFAVGDDIVGHELTHGFTQYTSSLFYSFDSGAINESMSDIFGEFIDQTDGVDGCAGSGAAENWLIGEDLPFGGPCNGQFRSMKDPPLFQNPDKTSSPYYYNGRSDHAGVHTNSGISNKAAYLITDGTSGEPGGSFNGQTITPLGISKAAQIFYELETHVMTSATNYRDLYNYLPRACTNLINTHGITSADCQQVTKAVTATEMNMTPPGAPTDAPICVTGGQVPTNLFFDNMENPSSGNWTGQVTQGSTNPWGYSTLKPYNGSRSLYGGNLGSTSDTNIHMNGSITLPANAYMYFQQYYQFEYDFTYNYDGGVVEYSTDGGSNWNDAQYLFDYNGYTDNLNYGTSPLGYRYAFVNVSRSYYSSRLNLNSLAGQSVQFRFRIGTDVSGVDIGWFIDDIRIYTCGPPVTTSTLTSTANPALVGQPVTFNATVTTTGSIAPTGSVTFKDNGTDLSTVALSGGHASFTTSSLSFGLHPITVTYSGDSNNSSSVSEILSQQVVIALTKLTLITSASPVFSGQSLTFKAIVTNPLGGVPTGTITFKDGGGTLATVPLSGGNASYTTSALSISSHLLTADYGGDSNNSVSTSNPVNQQILNTGCTSLMVTTVNDDNSCGSLRQALAVAHANAPSSGSTIVEIGSGLNAAVKLDGANGGVTLGLGITLQREGAGCGVSGPDKFIQAGTGSTGDGITMNKATLVGIWVSGFSGHQIVTFGGQSTGQSDNTLNCVKATKTNPA